MDDFTELHLYKRVAACEDACLACAPEHVWMYMCAAVKALSNSVGIGRYVYDVAAPLLDLPRDGPSLSPLISPDLLSSLELDDPDAGRQWPHGNNVEGTHLTRAMEGQGTQA